MPWPPARVDFELIKLPYQREMQKMYMELSGLGGHNGGHALDDDVAVLVGADGLQLQTVLGIVLLDYGAGSGNGVANANGLGELQFLIFLVMFFVISELNYDFYKLILYRLN